MNNDAAKQGFTNIYENTEPKDKPAAKRTTTPKANSSSTAKKYDVKDDDEDEEGIENPYGDMYLNEETILDIPISELENVIAEKKKNEEDGFKREYAVGHRMILTKFKLNHKHRKNLVYTICINLDELNVMFLN